MMKTINTATNKKAWELWQAYNKATDDSVLTAYKTSPSYAKINAENDIKKRMIEENGHGYKVMSHNTFGFTCGYLVDISNITKLLTVDTKSNTYRVLFNGVYNR